MSGAIVQETEAPDAGHDLAVRRRQRLATIVESRGAARLDELSSALGVSRAADGSAILYAGAPGLDVGDLQDALSRWDPRHVDAALAHLGETEAVRQIQRLGQTFWASADARYGWPPPGRNDGGNRSK